MNLEKMLLDKRNLIYRIAKKHVRIFGSVARKVDVVTEKGLRERIRSNVLREAKPL
jgi:predicted nucleotidyltransferase